MLFSPRYVYESVTLVEVIDGDTVKLFIDAGFGFLRAKWRKGKPEPFSYRLRRIDAPDRDKPQARAAAKAYLVTLLTGVRLRAETFQDPEKYGRYLLELDALVGETWINSNDALVSAGHAAYKTY